MATSPETPFIEEWLVGPQSTKFYTRTYLPSLTPKAAIVFVHGFAEHIGRYSHFHPLLTSRDIAVFAFDQRGFGLTAQDTKGNKSPNSSYGKTSWDEQMDDIEWAVKHAKKTWGGIPLFLMGHSMGGAEALGFACRESKSSEALGYLTAIIATSPLIQQTRPAAKMVKWVGGKLSNMTPGILIPAKVDAAHLSHDPAIYKAYVEDPLIKMSGSLRGINDMLTKGDWLLNTGCTQWKKDLPLLIVHGTGDQVTSHKASQKFHDTLPEGAKKKIQLFDGGYHELQNEPDGVKEKLADRIIVFVEEHLPRKSGHSKSSTPTSASSPVKVDSPSTQLNKSDATTPAPAKAAVVPAAAIDGSPEETPKAKI